MTVYLIQMFQLILSSLFIHKDGDWVAIQSFKIGSGKVCILIQNKILYIKHIK